MESLLVKTFSLFDQSFRASFEMQIEIVVGIKGSA